MYENTWLGLGARDGATYLGGSIWPRAQVLSPLPSESGVSFVWLILWLGSAQYLTPVFEMDDFSKEILNNSYEVTCNWNIFFALYEVLIHCVPPPFTFVSLSFLIFIFMYLLGCTAS